MTYHCWNTRETLEFIVNGSAINGFGILVDVFSRFFDWTSQISACMLCANGYIVRTAQSMESRL